MKRKWLRLAASVGFAAVLCGASTALAQTAPPLGVAAQFGALGNSGVTGATGSGVVINGDVGSSPTPTLSNFPPSSTVPPFTDSSLERRSRAAGAHRCHRRLQCDPGPGAGSGAARQPRNSRSPGPGLYSFVGRARFAGECPLTLNGTGIFIFNVDSSLTANVLSVVVGTANPCNIFWRVGSSATLNGTDFGERWSRAPVSRWVLAPTWPVARSLAPAPPVPWRWRAVGGHPIGGCRSPLPRRLGVP